MPERAIEEYRIVDEPFYLPVDHEVDLFEAAHSARLPVILKGPTGCGKTRFVEYMAWRLERPLITVACHEDLSSTDLVGRFLIEGQETVWYNLPCIKQEIDRIVAEQKPVFESFVRELRAVCAALAASPILAGSGEYELVETGRRSIAGSRPISRRQKAG